MKIIKISSSFGHEIMAMQFAKAYGVKVLIIPNKDDEAEYSAEAIKIYDFMHFFAWEGELKIEIVPFAKRNTVECRDIIAELKAGTLDDKEWNNFFRTWLHPAFYGWLPKYSIGINEKAVLFVPQKLKSDGECGVTAEQQSLTPAVFNFLKSTPYQLVLGQHFNKVTDIEAVMDLATDFGTYVPGLTENEKVFGIRGVKHEMYYNMYKNLSAAVGIAGTHTWYLLTMFPEIPQVILYNKAGVEHWEAIAKAARRHGRQVYAIGFDDNTNMAELAKDIEKAFRLLCF